MRTIYGVFDRLDQAKRAMTDFGTVGSIDRVGLLSGKSNGDASMKPVEVPGWGTLAANGPMRDMLASSPTSDGMRGALLNLGVSVRDVERCAEAIRQGAVLEAVVVDDDKEPDARAIMGRHARAPARDVEDIVVPVVREQLEVGIREVEAGGVRISSHVRELPVEQTITIREERVTVERRIIDRPIEETEQAFRDRTIELGTMAEEPVVTKRAHVVEEIRVHKDRNERVEKLTDTLRHTDVQLTELPGERTFDASRYREHFAKTYGDRYDLKTIAPAYEFGERLARRDGSGDWNKVELEARATWEQQRPGTWDRFKAAILAGWRNRG